MGITIDDHLAIQAVIARFANSFDLKDWDGLQACFPESIFTDYADLRGTPPETITASEYVRLRRESLDALKLHHLVSNYEIDFADANSATCRASMMVWRNNDVEVSASHCFYTFQLKRLETGDWKISGITQKIFWNDGSSSAQKGAK